MNIPNKLIESTKKWLGEDGIAFFAEELLSEDSWIHLHFREGMQVRNFLREQKECEGWSDHDFDNNWMEIVTEAIKL